ncbi:MAG: redoxin domain-containing protein, partial [Alphaproteobacteria bacterium]
MSASPQARPVSGGPFPALTLPLIGGGTFDAAAQDGWWMLVVYRGRHCPICKDYLGELQERLPDFQALGVSVIAVSADPAHKAQADVAEFGWTFPVAYDLAEDHMRRLGLYVSAPRSPQETDRLFP